MKRLRLLSILLLISIHPIHGITDISYQSATLFEGQKEKEVDKEIVTCELDTLDITDYEYMNYRIEFKSNITSFVFSQVSYKIQFRLHDTNDTIYTSDEFEIELPKKNIIEGIFPIDGGEVTPDLLILRGENKVALLTLKYTIRLVDVKTEAKLDDIYLTETIDTQFNLSTALLPTLKEITYFFFPKVDNLSLYQMDIEFLIRGKGDGKLSLQTGISQSSANISSEMSISLSTQARELNEVNIIYKGISAQVELYEVRIQLIRTQGKLLDSGLLIITSLFSLPITITFQIYRNRIKLENEKKYGLKMLSKSDKM